MMLSFQAYLKPERQGKCLMTDKEKRYWAYFREWKVVAEGRVIHLMVDCSFLPFCLKK